MLNKKLALGLAMSGNLIASLAHAQNTVTLYGQIDAGLMYTNDVKHGATQGSLFQATSGNTNGSQFGIRGSEDLGGGVKTIFKLENGFNIQNGKLGQDNRLFGRQAYVGIRDEQLGTLTVGRQYDSGIDYVAPLSEVAYEFGKTGFAHPFDNDNLDYSVRINNSVKFASSNFRGFRFGTLYSFSNNTDFAENRAYSVGASYGRGPLNVGASYLQIDRSNSTNTSGAIDTAESTSNGTGGFVLGADVQRVAAAGLNYAFGQAVVGFVYSHSEFEGTESFGSANGTVRFDNYELNSRYALTPTLKFGIAYAYTDGHVGNTTTYGSDPKWSQVNTQFLYSLSKRTDMYLETMYQHVSGKRYVAFVDTAGGASSDATQIVATVGLRTRF
jgi:predicted porin